MTASVSNSTFHGGLKNFYFGYVVPMASPTHLIHTTDVHATNRDVLWTKLKRASPTRGDISRILKAGIKTTRNAQGSGSNPLPGSRRPEDNSW